MQDLRKIMAWLFALELLGIPLFVLRAIDGRHSLVSPRDWLTWGVSAALIIVFGVSWWTVWKSRPSARLWGLAGSLAFILIYFQPILFATSFTWWHALGDLLLGIVGLLAFSQPLATNTDGEPSEAESPPD